MSEKEAELVGLDFGGQVSPTSLLANALQNAGQFRMVAIVAVTEDDDVVCGWSEGEPLEHMGAATYLAQSIREDCFEFPTD